MAQYYLGDFDKNLKSIDTMYPPRIDAYHVALAQYEQAIQEYQAAAQRYPADYQSWLLAYHDAAQRQGTASMWFWIVLIATPVAYTWYRVKNQPLVNGVDQTVQQVEELK